MNKSIFSYKGDLNGIKLNKLLMAEFKDAKIHFFIGSGEATQVSLSSYENKNFSYSRSVVNINSINKINNLTNFKKEEKRNIPGKHNGVTSNVKLKVHGIKTINRRVQTL